MDASLLTGLDKFEKFSQVFYAGSLLFAAPWWLSDNFLDQSSATNSVSLALCGIMGLLCAIICMFTGIVRASPACKPVLRTFDLATTVAWGVCGVMTFTQKELYKPEKFMINVGLQLGLSAAYFYQASTR